MLFWNLKMSTKTSVAEHTFITSKLYSSLELRSDKKYFSWELFEIFFWYLEEHSVAATSINSRENCHIDKIFHNFLKKSERLKTAKTLSLWSAIKLQFLNVTELILKIDLNQISFCLFRRSNSLAIAGT